MSFVALDIATKTGWAQYEVGWAKPLYGLFDLAVGDPGEVGRRCVQLHRKLADLHALCPITHLVFESGIAPGALSGRTTMTTIYLLAGLAAHAESFAYAVGARCRNVPNAAWRRHFIGKGSGFSSKDFKRMSMERCHSLDWHPADDNVADSLGILEYAVHLAGISPPWLEASAFGRAQV